MNILNKPKQIKLLSENLRIAEWQVHKAIYELGTGDSNIITKHFEQNSLENRLKEFKQRIEEIHIYLMQSRTINIAEYNLINVRVSHLKEDTKSLVEDFSDIRPNIIGVIKEYILKAGDDLLRKNLSQEDFIVGLEIALNNIKNENSKS